MRKNRKDEVLAWVFFYLIGAILNIVVISVQATGFFRVVALVYDTLMAIIYAIYLYRYVERRITYD